MRLKPARGTAWVPLLLVLAVILIFGNLIAWLLGAALTIVFLAIKLSVALLFLLVVLFFIMRMARKVSS